MQIFSRKSLKNEAADRGCGTVYEGNTRRRVNSYSTVVEYPTLVGIYTPVEILTISDHVRQLSNEYKYIQNIFTLYPIDRSHLTLVE